MNGDPYRTPQPADRRVINRSAQAYQREEPQLVKEEAKEPKPISRSTSSSHHQVPQKSSKKGLLWTLIIALIILALVVVGWFLIANSKNANTGINTTRYQAVFLVNGQIYFGKLQDFSDASFKLTDIYYPQAQSTGEDDKTPSKTETGGIQLIRLGDEVHGPESEMFISKEQVLYYENLKSDSRVTQLIEQNETK